MLSHLMQTKLGCQLYHKKRCLQDLQDKFLSIEDAAAPRVGRTGTGINGRLQFARKLIALKRLIQLKERKKTMVIGLLFSLWFKWMISLCVVCRQASHLSWSVRSVCACTQEVIRGLTGRLYWEQEAWSCRIWERISNSCQSKKKTPRGSNHRKINTTMHLKKHEEEDTYSSVLFKVNKSSLQRGKQPMLDLNTVSQSIICNLGGVFGVVRRTHLNRVSQCCVQHHEHGQISTEIRHHTATQTLSTQIKQHVSIQHVTLTLDIILAFSFFCWMIVFVGVFAVIWLETQANMWRKKHFTHAATPGRKHAPCQQLHKLRAASPFLLLLQAISYHLSGCWAELRRFGAIWLTPVLQKAENTSVNLKENRIIQGINVTVRWWQNSRHVT